jgi:hypothetical protein
LPWMNTIGAPWPSDSRTKTEPYGPGNG